MSAYGIGNLPFGVFSVGGRIGLGEVAGTVVT